MEEFYTRATANEGQTLPLYLPDGSKSEHTFLVRGVDSDEFRAAETKAKRQAINIAQIDDETERAAAVREAELSCIAALIISWSFKKECSTENKMEFLREAPQIADGVNRFAAQRGRFYVKKSTSFADGSEVKES